MARIEEKKKKQLAQEDAFVQVKRWRVLAPPLEKRLRIAIGCGCRKCS
jgi:hypothetical protein